MSLTLSLELWVVPPSENAKSVASRRLVLTLLADRQRDIVGESKSSLPYKVESIPTPQPTYRLYCGRTKATGRIDRIKKE